MESARSIRLWFAACLVLAAVAATYGRSLSHPYVWTDHAEIVQGALVPTNAQEVWRSLTMAKGSAKQTARSALVQTPASQGRWAYWRPVKALSYGLDHLVGGGSPWAYHLTNLLLHTGACLFLLVFIRQATADRLPGLAEGVALVQAVAPLHVEAVAWISARSDVMVALATWLSAWALLRARAASSVARGVGWRLLCGLAVVLAIGSKETGLVAVALLGLVSLLVPDPRRPGWLGRLVAECWLPGLLAMGLLVWRLGVVADIQVGALGARSGLGLWTSLDLFGRNLGMSFLPVWSSVADTVRVIDGPSLAAVAGPLVWLTWVGVGIGLRKRSPLVLVSALGWLLAVAPVSQIVSLLHPRGDRYLYLPTALACLTWGLLAIHLARLAAKRWPKSRISRWVPAALLLALLASLGLRTQRPLSAWSDERTLFRGATSAEPNCVECWNNLAYASALAGDYAQAVGATRAGLGVDRSRFRGAKDSFSLHWILAQALLKLDRGDESAAELELILVKAGPSRQTLSMLAQAYLAADRPAHALAATERALTSAPRDRGLLRLLVWCASREVQAGYPWLFDFPEGCLAPP